MTRWTIVRQAPVSMGISRHEYRSGLPCPPLGYPNPGIEIVSSVSPALAGIFFATSSTWEDQIVHYITNVHKEIYIS